MSETNGTTATDFSKKDAIPIAIIFVVLGVFGAWWSAANPSARLEKIENTAIDLANKITITYTTLKAHEDLQNRLLADISELKKRDEESRNLSLTRAQFEAWKTERDLYLSELVKRLDRMREDERLMVTHQEFLTATANVKDRIDQLYSLYRALEVKESPRNGK